VAMGVYLDNKAEKEQASASNAKYASLLGGSSLSGEEVTHDAFKAYVEDYHFYGHITVQVTGAIYSIGHYNSTYFRASPFNDIFSLKLRTPVVALIACESAHQEAAPGDEPMGIVSAFLVSGASSVLCTLWPI